MSEKTQKLQVFHLGRKVGVLSYHTREGSFQFNYDEEWVNNRGFALSPNIEFHKKVESYTLSNFLENLLPEGSGLKDLSSALKIPKSNIFALIKYIGLETTGALEFKSDDRKTETVFRPVSIEELKIRIAQRQNKSIGEWDGKQRFSVAGIQEKLPIVLKGDQYGFGEGEMASTHILKFGNKKNLHLVINEYFCMSLAKATGINVAECELLQMGEQVLQVKRFDRAWNNGETVKRFHIIDGCQALNISPIYKYEKWGRSGGQDDLGPANLENLFKFAKKCTVPARTQFNILQWVFFNLIVGNSDSHMKNISFFINEKGIQLTPFYDLVSVTMYSGVDHSLAFQIGEAFELSEVNSFQLSQMAEDLGLNTKFVGIQLKKILNSVLKQLPVIDIGKLNKDESKFIGELRGQIEKRAKRFLNEADKF